MNRPLAEVIRENRAALRPSPHEKKSDRVAGWVIGLIVVGVFGWMAFCKGFWV